MVIALKDISFLSVLNVGKASEIISIVEVNDRVSLIVAHYFSVQLGLGEKICQVSLAT